jgi:hypothetical protein
MTQLNNHQGAVSTLVARPYPGAMDTENTRVTRAQAAALAGVTERTINRWSAEGRIGVWRPAGPWGPAEYDAREVLAAASRTLGTPKLPDPGTTDIST